MKKTTGAVLHAAAAAAMLAVLASCGAKKGTFKPGDYTAAEKGMNGDVTVTATFSQDRIEKITVESKETDSIGKVAMDKLTKQIIDRQSIAVDAVAGATISSNAFLKALEADIKKAGGNPDAFRTAAAKTGTDETIDTQVVVVGGGAAGTAAALQAVQFVIPFTKDDEELSALVVSSVEKLKMIPDEEFNQLDFESYRVDDDNEEAIAEK